MGAPERTIQGDQLSAARPPERKSMLRYQNVYFDSWLGELKTGDLHKSKETALRSARILDEESDVHVVQWARPMLISVPADIPVE